MIVCSQSAAKDIINMTKEMAYIVGVYLGDGSIGTDKRTFCLQSIDKDFCETTERNISTLTQNSPRIVQMKRLTTAKRVVWGLYLSDVKLCSQLRAMTNDRKNLPKDIHTWSRENIQSLIAGLLDSEGYVTRGRLHYSDGAPVFNMVIGIGACDQWLIELRSLCLTMGIKLGLLCTEVLPSGKNFYKFIFNKKSFISSGLYFTIKRKNDRIEEYKRLFPGSTTTRNLPRTEQFKRKLSTFSQNRKRVGGRFVPVGNDIV